MLLDTPNHPEYPCGHCGFAWTVATVLEPDAGADTVFTWTSEDKEQGTRRATLREHAEQTSLSRLYAGVHFRFTLDRTDEMGRALGRLALEKFARPLATAKTAKKKTKAG